MARTRRRVPAWFKKNTMGMLGGNDGVFRGSICAPHGDKPNCMDDGIVFWTPGSKRFVKAVVVGLRRRKGKAEARNGLRDLDESVQHDQYLQQLADFNAEFRADVDQCINGDLVLQTHWHDPEYCNYVIDFTKLMKKLQSAG